MTPNEKRPQQDCGGMFAQVQASVEILSPVPVSGKCCEKDYERLFIRDSEVKAREGKMAYVRPEYHERIMCITRVIGHDRLMLSAFRPLRWKRQSIWSGVISFSIFKSDLHVVSCTVR